MFGWTELLIIFGVLIVIFGASRIPKIARSLGQSVNEFKAGLSEEEETPPKQLDDSTESAEVTDKDEENS